jgi:hypothetical protein
LNFAIRSDAYAIANINTAANNDILSNNAIFAYLRVMPNDSAIIDLSTSGNFCGGVNTGHGPTLPIELS